MKFRKNQLLVPVLAFFLAVGVVAVDLDGSRLTGQVHTLQVMECVLVITLAGLLVWRKSAWRALDYLARGLRPSDLLLEPAPDTARRTGFVEEADVSKYMLAIQEGPAPGGNSGITVATTGPADGDAKKAEAALHEL